MLGLKLTTFVATVLLTFAQVGFSQSSSDVYADIGVLKGQARFINHPELGNTPANSVYLVFQRVGCRMCLIGTWTDVDGKYKLFLGKGKYELIVFQPSPPIYNLLAPDQPKFLNVDSSTVDNIFDIRLRFKKANE